MLVSKAHIRLGVIVLSQTFSSLLPAPCPSLQPLPPKKSRKRPQTQMIVSSLSVRLGDTLELTEDVRGRVRKRICERDKEMHVLLLLDGETVGRSLGGVDELIGETLTILCDLSLVGERVDGTFGEVRDEWNGVRREKGGIEVVVKIRSAI